MSDQTIRVRLEGRDDIYVPDKDSLIGWIKSQNFEYIHNFIPQGGLMIGADHDTDGVINDIENADSLAITIGNAWKNNMRHALAIIKNNRLELYDIGEITDNQLMVVA